MEFQNQLTWTRQSKSTWLDQIRKDNPQLRDEQFYHFIDEKIIAPSFAFPTDLKDEGLILNQTGTTGHWKTGLYLGEKELDSLKSKLHLALEQGVEYLHLDLSGIRDSEFLVELLNGVRLDMIHTTWTCHSQELMNGLSNYIQKRFPGSDVRLIFDSKTNSEKISYDYLSSTFRFNIFHIDGWATTLKQMLTELSQYKKIPDRALIVLILDNNILLNICQARALVLILNKIWNLFSLDARYFLEARIHPDVLTEDVYSNIYKFAAITLSGVIAGAEFIALSSVDKNFASPQDPWLKYSLHLQHIIKYEAQLNHITDLTAGSYYIEDVTEQMAEAVWIKLQEKLQND